MCWNNKGLGLASVLGTKQCIRKSGEDLQYLVRLMVVQKTPVCQKSLHTSQPGKTTINKMYNQAETNTQTQ